MKSYTEEQVKLAQEAINLVVDVFDKFDEVTDTITAKGDDALKKLEKVSEGEAILIAYCTAELLPIAKHNDPEWKPKEATRKDAKQILDASFGIAELLKRLNILN